MTVFGRDPYSDTASPHAYPASPYLSLDLNLLLYCFHLFGVGFIEDFSRPTNGCKSY
jgi:hypothetical protein